MIIVSEWIKESREVRTSHLKLDSTCIERGGNSTVHRGVLAQYLNTDFPSKIDLCHACNNDKCSNPTHLYWGTRKENVKDSIDAGTFNNAWDSMILKYGSEDAAKAELYERGSKGWVKGGQAGKGRNKSEEQKRKTSESLKKKL